MKARITFDVKDKVGFLLLAQCSRLPDGKWELFDDYGFIILKDSQTNEVKNNE